MHLIPALKLFLIYIVLSTNSSTDNIIQTPPAPDCNRVRTNNESICLACNLYYEARSETIEGMIAVANVTRNRVDSDRFPDNFCAVVWQRRQYSWTFDGKSDKVRNKRSWKESYKIANNVVISYRNGYMVYNDNTHGSLWYHADYISPTWSNKVLPEIKIGKHIFYTQVAELRKKHSK